RFGELHRRAAGGELWHWRSSAEGRLAEIIILDQFSRNLYRDRPEAFAQDGMALVLAQEAISLGLDEELPVVQRSFMYMPFMHSESLAIHDRAVKLFDVPGMGAAWITSTATGTSSCASAATPIAMPFSDDPPPMRS